MSDFLTSEQLAATRLLLSDYAPSATILDQVKSTIIGAIIGPAGSGKDTLRKELLRQYPTNYSLLVSDTSRPKRADEVEGFDYHFKAFEQIYAGLIVGEYMQVAIVHEQQISGLSANELKNIADNKVALSILVIDTVHSLTDQGCDVRAVFLVPPSYQQMISRLSLRNGMDASESRRRLHSAIEELKQAQVSNFQLIVTDNVEKVVAISNNYLTKNIIDIEEIKTAKKIIKNLLQDLQAQFN
jgi:guanylate kinase